MPIPEGPTVELDKRTTPPDDAALADVGAGLDALDVPQPDEKPWWRRLAGNLIPPLISAVLVIAIWQLLWALAIWPEYKLPAPIDVWDEFWTQLSDGNLGEFLWTSMHRAVLGFAAAVAIATPIGLVVAKVKFIRAAVGPLLTGLQTLPSVAWVPAAILWFGITDAAIYTVVLLGAVPSIANGLIAGIDQIPRILPRVGKTMGAQGVSSARHILLPAALPGYIAGCKQGWAFSWRSLMAAELIANSPQLGTGLGTYLQQQSDLNQSQGIMAAIMMILIVGIGIDLLVFRPLERRVLRARGLAIGA